MASGNSQEIINYKQEAISRIINSDIIVEALDARHEDGTPMDVEELYYTHIFPYGYIPGLIDKAGCYIALEVSMPKVSTANYFFKDILLTIYIICHQDFMKTDYGATRIDYISVALDKLFNGKKGMGTTEMTLVSNTEAPMDTVHRARVMRFQTTDVKKSLCFREDE